MFYEKIKIYVTKTVADVLVRDADFFGFKKKDGLTTNKNAFLSALILNYYDDFVVKQKLLGEKIEKILKQTGLSENKNFIVKNSIIEAFNKGSTSSSFEKCSELVSLKPTKETSSLIDYIEGYLLQGASLSEYFRNMFTSYAYMPQDKRAEIIFKRQYSTIENAIKQNKKIFIVINGSEKLEVSPYSICRSKEEFYLYLLCSRNDYPMTVKLNKITSVTTLEKVREFGRKDILVFDKMIKYGPQFIYDPNDEPTVVKLTEGGIKRFKKFYVHRPIPDIIDKNVYTFNCSPDQVFQYFIKFGKDAEIVSPYYLRERAMRFLSSALKNYKHLK